MKEFKKARFGLAIWYILISFGMLVIFSFAAIGAERRAFSRIEQVLSNRTQRPALSALLEKRLTEFDANFIGQLIVFDIILLFVSAGLSYYLSGMTLKPIQEMVKRQEEFAADASHELRTPLTTIGIEIEAFKRTEKLISKKGLALFESVTDEINRMRQTIEGLLVLVRGEQSARGVKSLLVLGVLTDLKKHLAKQFAEKKVTLKDLTPKNLKARIAEDDLRQALSILLDNAIKYTPKGGLVTIRGRILDSAVELELEDTGIGIAEKDLAHVFERFYRGESGAEGTGLGLAIAKKIVNNYNGTIDAESTLGKGTVIRITLPK